MAKMFVWEVKGIKPFQKKMKRLRPVVQKRVSKKAVKRAGAIVRMHMRKIVKKNAIDDGMPNGHLFQQIINKVSMHNEVPVVTVGAEYTRVSISHLVHDGTDPHEISVPWSVHPVDHPGSRPYPFAIIALKESHGRAESEMVKKLKTEIAKEMKKK